MNARDRLPIASRRAVVRAGGVRISTPIIAVHALRVHGEPPGLRRNEVYIGGTRPQKTAC